MIDTLAKLPFPSLSAEPQESDELYRILFSNIERKINGRPYKSIALTSTVKGEGKTTTIIQLAKVGARDFGKRILLLEGDLKNPQLNSLISNHERADRAIGETPIQGLEVLTLGNITKNRNINGPAFASGLKKVIETVSSGYDYVFVDCPPIMPLVDMQIIGQVVDGVVIVIRAEGPSRNLVIKAMEAVPKEKILGVVFNGMHLTFPQYGYGYKY